MDKDVLYSSMEVAIKEKNLEDLECLISQGVAGIDFQSLLDIAKADLSLEAANDKEQCAIVACLFKQGATLSEEYQNILKEMKVL